jgi:hypothetical protein
MKILTPLYLVYSTYRFTRVGVGEGVSCPRSPSHTQPLFVLNIHRLYKRNFYDIISFFLEFQPLYRLQTRWWAGGFIPSTCPTSRLALRSYF